MQSIKIKTHNETKRKKIKHLNIHDIIGVSAAQASQQQRQPENEARLTRLCIQAFLVFIFSQSIFHSFTFDEVHSIDDDSTIIIILLFN